jgi:hypothetical protein
MLCVVLMRAAGDCTCHAMLMPFHADMTPMNRTMRSYAMRHAMTYATCHLQIIEDRETCVEAAIAMYNGKARVSAANGTRGSEGDPLGTGELFQ